jgi:V8-like Glu-specific endopeptidase/peptidoglycan hydrolase-like protein with peptidoglycan-binding domain
VISFDRSSFGKAVWSQTESTVSDIQLELSIGDYKNEPIINYSDRSELAQFGRSVGRLDVLTDKGIHRCTAFIVSKQYILTNYHCSIGVLDNTRLGATRIEAISFVTGYTQTGVEEGTNKYIALPNAVEFNKELDYAVLEVIGDPSAEYGELKLASLAPQSGDPFWIIGHPLGEGQRVSREKCRASEPAVSVGKLLHTCDTLPGNSGSPVIDVSLRQVVALHHAGSQKDSVNFAILMSEILKNSKILTAYKVPEALPTANAEPAKTAEAIACDALYSAAAEAKACFAYEAYFKSCRDHSLAPIADGYIQEFCQVAETVDVDEAPEPPANVIRPAVRQLTIVEANDTGNFGGKCSDKNTEYCNDNEICSLATYGYLLKFWQYGYTTAVAEAKKRGLTCGVKEETVKVDDAPEKGSSSCRVTPSSIKYCEDKRVCEWFYARFTFNEDGSVMAESDRNFVQLEAKKRGLNCGVRNKNNKKVLIKSIQTELNRLGCNAGPEDGVAGPQTIAAAKLFSENSNILYYPNIIYKESFATRLEKSQKICPTPKLPLKWQIKLSCPEVSTRHLITTLNLKPLSKNNNYSYVTDPTVSTGTVTVSGNSVTMIIMEDDGTKDTAKLELSEDRKTMRGSVNLKQSGAGNCTLVGKSVNQPTPIFSLKSGFEYKRKMFGTAVCKKDSGRSKTYQIKATNDLWIENTKEYLTTRYEFDKSGTYYTYNFTCNANNKQENCLKTYKSDDDTGSVTFKKDKILAKMNGRVWGNCAIVVQ